VNTNHSVQLDALGDATRRAILARLVQEGPLPVGELAREFHVSRPAISQHLRVLKHANLVTDRAEALASLRKYFEQFWSQALAAFKRHVEAGANTKTKKR
jgi:DNA-binding transcriptional ArsR family regulator